MLIHVLHILIQQVTDKLCKGHIVSRYRRILGETFPVPPYDLHAVFLLVGLNLAELVFVGGQQALHGLPRKHELEVVLEPIADPLGLERGQEQEVALVVHLDVDVHALQSSVQNLQNPLPVGAGHFGDVAVEEVVLVVHQDVLEQRLSLQGAQGPDVVGHVLLVAHGPDGPVTDLLQDLNANIPILPLKIGMIYLFIFFFSIVLCWTVTIKRILMTSAVWNFITSHLGFDKH